MTDELLHEALGHLVQCRDVLGAMSRMRVDEICAEYAVIHEAASILSLNADDLIMRAYREGGIDADPPDLMPHADIEDMLDC